MSHFVLVRRDDDGKKIEVLAGFLSKDEVVTAYREVRDAAKERGDDWSRYGWQEHKDQKIHLTDRRGN